MILLISNCLTVFFVSYVVVFCPPRTFDFGDEINNFSKSKFSRKNMILAVWVYAFDWNFYTTIWHYLAILCLIFRVVSFYLTDWEHVSWVTFFFAHLVAYHQRNLAEWVVTSKRILSDSQNVYVFVCVFVCPCVWACVYTRWSKKKRDPRNML